MLLSLTTKSRSTKAARTQRKKSLQVIEDTPHYKSNFITAQGDLINVHLRGKTSPAVTLIRRDYHLHYARCYPSRLCSFCLCHFRISDKLIEWFGFNLVVKNKVKRILFMAVDDSVKICKPLPYMHMETSTQCFYNHLETVYLLGKTLRVAICFD
ncbi:hypothetical protein BD560DRAFT_419889 [Blakeslea trispora]|nr:hypothetical protein BD560DRAFT_419889 [Blakeslea trispora]